MLDASDSHRKKLEQLRQICTDYKIILIFDEIITGFRWPNYCVANDWGIKPDLICMGKALGNGRSISVLGGRADLLDNPDYFVSGTFFGEIEPILSAKEILNYLTPGKLDQLWAMGEEFQRNFNSRFKDIQLRGYPTRAVWDGDRVMEFVLKMHDYGYILHPRTWFLNFEHTHEILTQFINDAEEVLK